ncbi:MAG: UDP-N-acetylglucosamine--N-acetylmuramyl-(pentapeptide) pyrophosphoryl-undecaprenol N-acetylglucosamine transferase, partial [Actinomycetia bacterium]|nr:UDP-N-acetylglucosamine--N-acetylmuramyl-(pentapeptide) pyrophosphoryl-undecaprenol N-acetylglucosamine transferase [Actinomycetes bacterium]
TTTTSDDPSGRRWRRRFVITGGGTAGHTNPGIAVAEALVRAGISAEQVHFVGGQRGNERTLVPEAGFSIDLLPGRGIERRISLASIGAVFSLIAGVVKGFWLVLRHRPMVVLCLGGYAAFAVSMAAVILRVPLVVTEQNAKASAVNRLMGRFAKVCALPFPGTDLPKGVVTGNPSLAAVVESVASGDVGRARDDLGLPRDRVVIGVFSGSLGATSVNSATRDLAERWADRSDLAIRHVIGRRDWDEFSTPPPAIAAGDLIYQVVEYETEMPKLLVAADLAISRAGASTVAELAIAGVPSVLVPLPIAPRGAQRANAEELVAAGGAIVVVDDELDAERLVVELGPLVNNGERRMKMADAAAAVARPDAADHVAELLLEAANHPLGRKQ